MQWSARPWSLADAGEAAAMWGNAGTLAAVAAVAKKSRRVKEFLVIGSPYGNRFWGTAMKKRRTDQGM